MQQQLQPSVDPHRSQDSAAAKVIFFFFGFLFGGHFSLLAPSHLLFWAIFWGSVVHGYTPGCGGHERGHRQGSQWHGWLERHVCQQNAYIVVAFSA